MKSPWCEVFKDAAAQTASKCGLPIRIFIRDWGLQDFLIETLDQADSPQEIAARALDQLCERGNLSRDKVVSLTVVQFLNETVGKPLADPHMQRVRDLSRLVKAGSGYQAYLAWARTWYP